MLLSLKLQEIVSKSLFSQAAFCFRDTRCLQIFLGSGGSAGKRLGAGLGHGVAAGSGGQGTAGDNSDGQGTAAMGGDNSEGQERRAGDSRDRQELAAAGRGQQGQ